MWYSTLYGFSKGDQLSIFHYFIYTAYIISAEITNFKQNHFFQFEHALRQLERYHRACAKMGSELNLRSSPVQEFARGKSTNKRENLII